MADELEIRRRLKAGEWVNNTDKIHPSDDEIVSEPGNVCKPCWELGWCPYGQLVEAYPTISPLAYEIADVHGLWMVACDNQTGEPLDDAGVEQRAGRVGFRWTRMDHRPDGAAAVPDVSEMVRRGLDDDSGRCSVFGHECPVFYLAEGFSEKE